MRSILLAVVLLTMSASPLVADVRDDARAFVKFGIEVARHRLWREAIANFQRAAALDPSYAAAFNNLAIAFEQQGDLGSARDAYERAMKLDPDNQYIKQNYELFKEINDRAIRQGSR